MTSDKIKIAVLGGSGYTAVELLKILLRHPDVRIEAVGCGVGCLEINRRLPFQTLSGSAATWPARLPKEKTAFTPRGQAMLQWRRNLTLVGLAAWLLGAVLLLPSLTFHPL